METKILSNFLFETNYQNLNVDTVELAKMCILDFTGVALAGSRERASIILRNTLMNSASAGGAVLLDGSFRRTNASTAAAVNAASAHSQDFDDLHNSSIVHPGVITIPTALALGQEYGLRGDSVLLAIVLGYDVAARVGETINPSAYRFWHTTAVAGPFSSAAVAAKLWALTPEQTAHALGSAGTQAGGLWAFLSEGAMSKLLHVANANLCGIRAAELTRNGFTGSTEILESPQGFARALSAEPHLSCLTDRLGDPFKITSNSFKPYACCRHTHSACYGIYALREKYQIAPEDVERIKDDTYSTAIHLTNNPHPANPYAAKFSLQYCIAAALLYPSLHEAAFAWDKLESPQVQDLMQRVEICLSQEVDAIYQKDSNQWGHRLRITLKNGKVIEEFFNYPFGDFQNPFTWEDARQKYMLLAEPVLGKEHAGRIYGRIRTFDQLTNLQGLFE